MKIAALNRIRQKLANHEPVYGMFVTLESASITEMAVAMGLDWIVVDAEHGHLDWKEINDHVRAAIRSRTVLLVRLAERSTSLTKRALDIGADGIVVPWVESVEQIEQALLDCRYPPEGRRGIGAERATVWGQCIAEHASEANEHVLVVPMLESISAVEHIEAMCQLEGVEMFLIGPADLSATAGSRGQWEGPGVAQQILQLKDAIRSAGKFCGLLTTSVEDLVHRRDQGFQVLGLGSDAALVFRSLHQALGAVERDVNPAPSLDPEDSQEVRSPLPRAPENLWSNRPEVITPLKLGQMAELQPGVSLAALVGQFNGARNLTTGIVTIHPSASLDYHVHPCSESIVVLDGELEVQVEGRAYKLGPLDNITIPRWIPHTAINPSTSRPARLHVALAMSSPERELVTRCFQRTEMPCDSTGQTGVERVTRFRSAKRSFNVGPGAEFIDYFNADLVPGIEMSGGFARFQPGGRLPAHLHDFDESISIVQGEASCLVEGRRYSLNDCATAMVPRGRVHYFVNESPQAMDMIWVYAGPLPERIVVETHWQMGMANRREIHAS